MRIGVDLGGTKIEAIALADDGTVLSCHRTATPQGDYSATLDATVAAIEQVESQAGYTAQDGTIGVAIPGAVSPQTGLVKNANSTCLIGHAFDQDLGARLRRPVRMANDANCFTLSEATDGAGAGAASVFGVILGTGVGGGLVIDGRLHAGANLIAGEWGHNALPWPDDDERPGPNCYCGKQGCVETFLSGPGFEADFRRASGKSLSAQVIAQQAAAGDENSEDALARYERRLAKALAAVINIVDPEAIILGGGVSNIDRLYETVPRLWLAHVFSDTVSTKLLQAKHGDSSGVRGAAWLWPVKAAP